MEKLNGKKPPAHEVVLGHLEGTFQEWRRTSEGRSHSHTDFLLCRFELLCCILAEMELPAGSREETIRRIQKVAERCRAVYSLAVAIALSPADTVRRRIKEERAKDPFLDSLGKLIHELRAERA